MARGMLQNSYQLVSEQFDPDIEDNTFGAQMEERMRNLQCSQIELKETNEHHDKLLTEILRYLENLWAAHSVAKARDNIAINMQGVDGSWLMTGGILVWQEEFIGMERLPHLKSQSRHLFQVNYTQLLIHGQLLDATLGKTFPTLYPTTGVVIVHVDEGDPKDVNYAVMMALKFHGINMLATMRAVICLKEKELEFKFVPVNIAAGDHKKEHSISQIPFGPAPALKDGDLKLIDLRAIMKDISHEYTSKGTELIYRDSKKKMTVMVWMEVEAHQFDWDASKRAGELFYKPIFGLTTSPAVVATSTEKPGKVLDVYEARRGQNEYLGGETFMLIDLHHLHVSTI